MFFCLFNFVLFVDSEGLEKKQLLKRSLLFHKLSVVLHMRHIALFKTRLSIKKRLHCRHCIQYNFRGVNNHTIHSSKLSKFRNEKETK
jgi:hypothetical protein